jgi:hypothetical protein
MVVEMGIGESIFVIIGLSIVIVIGCIFVFFIAGIFSSYLYMMYLTRKHGSWNSRYISKEKVDVEEVDEESQEDDVGVVCR